MKTDRGYVDQRRLGWPACSWRPIPKACLRLEEMGTVMPEPWETFLCPSCLGCDTVPMIVFDF